MARPFHMKHGKRRGGYQVRRRVRGPGKFEGEDVLSLFAYQVILDGCDTDSCGDDNGGDSYSLVDGPFDPTDLKQTIDTLRGNFEYVFLNRIERRTIAKKAGCIVHERGDGFVFVDWFESPDKLESAWLEIVSQYEPEDEPY